LGEHAANFDVAIGADRRNLSNLVIGRDFF